MRGNFFPELAYRISEEAVLNFRPDSGEAILSHAGILDLYGYKMFHCPDRSLTLSFSEFATWDFNKPQAFRLTPDQLALFLEFSRPKTPRQAMQHATTSGADTDLVWQWIGIFASHNLIELLPGQDEIASPGNLTRGVLIIAIGLPYVRMATTLAHSLRVTDPRRTVPIAILHDVADTSYLDDIAGDSAVFDIRIPVKRSAFSGNGKFSPFVAKTHADKYTPFDLTLLIDADTIVFPGAPLADQFNLLANTDMAPASSAVFPTRGEYPLALATTRDVAELIAPKFPIYRIHSYFMLFRKNDATREFFANARQLMSRAFAKSSFPRYRGLVPDEPIFSAATSITNVTIHSASYMPLADPAFIGGVVNPRSIRRKFLGMTMIGSPPDAYVALYNSVAREVGLLNDCSAGCWLGK